MKLTTLTFAGPMGAVLLVAVGLSAPRSPATIPAGAVLSLVVMVLSAAALFGCFRRGWARTGWFGMLVLAVDSGAAPAQQPVTVGSPGEYGRTLDLVVVEAKDGQPLPGVALSVLLSPGGHARRQPADLTDERGRRRIDVSGGPWFFVAISARKEGYVPVQVRWDADRLRAGLPDSYLLKLERGTTIGGTLQDERGRPIEGAKVYPSLQGKGTRDEPEELYLDDDYYVETDALGRWRCTMMPADLDEGDRLMFRLTHRDYASEPETIYPRRLPFEQLRAMAGVFVMRDGLTVSGRVIDSRGRPIEGARVVLGLPGFSPMPEILRTEADTEGRFRWEHAAPGRMLLIVGADDHASSVRDITVETGQAPVEVRLTSIAEARSEIRERLAEESKKPDEWKPWLMTGLLAASTTAALVSWARAWRRRSLSRG